MKIFTSMTTVALLCVSTASHAVVYQVTGTLAGGEARPAGTNYPVAITLTADPRPAFTGVWDLVPLANVFAGAMDFEAYSRLATWYAPSREVLGTTLVEHPHEISVINTTGASFHFDPVQRSFYFSEGSLIDTGDTPVCVATTGAATCSPPFGPNDGTASQSMSLFVNFDEDYRSFEGYGSIYFTYPDGAAQSNYYSFSGTYLRESVPVPAAAWLLGSGLLGLGAVARRRNPVL